MGPDRETGERGLSEALERLRMRLSEGGWYTGPFVESLVWVTALKELHKNRVDYQSQDGKLLKAIGWARNYPPHQLIVPVRRDLTRSGLVGVALVGTFLVGGGGRFAWVDESELPRQKIENDGRRQLYEDHLAGRDPLSPLEEAERYLRTL